MDVLTVAIPTELLPSYTYRAPTEPERRGQAHGWASRWARLLSHPRRRGALVGFGPLSNRVAASVAASVAYGSGSCLASGSYLAPEQMLAP